MSFIEVIEKKRILFITTKNIDYIRNIQEIKLLVSRAQKVEKIYSDKRSYLGRIIEIWLKILTCSSHDFDYVFLGFAPQLVMPIVKRRLKNKPIIIDFFISVYDTLVCDRKSFSINGVVAKICHALDEYTLKKADFVITDTKAHADYFISEFNGNAEAFETLYLEADQTIYYPRAQSKPREMQNKFIVLYFGSILPLQGVDIVLGAIKELTDIKDIYFDIIGPIPSTYEKPIHDNIHYTDWLSQEELAEHISNADLCLAGHFNSNIDKAKRTIPGKAYIYEMMKKPMILGDGVANHEIFHDDDSHKFIKMGDSQALAKAIVEYRYENKFVI